MASRFLSTLPDAPAVLRRMSLRAPFATGIAPDFRAVSPRDTLGGLLGLSGTLRLAELLGTIVPKMGATRRPRPEIPRFVGDRTSAIRLEAISALAIANAGPEGAVPDAAELASALTAAQALGNRQRRRWEKAGKALGPRYARPFGAVVTQARKKLGWVRADAVAMLRAGPHDEALVELDLALHASMEPGVQRALVRAEAALSGYFVESLIAAGKRLEPSAGLSDVAIWLERGGWVEVFLRNLGELALALIDREIDAVRALVDGALASSVRENAP